MLKVRHLQTSIQVSFKMQKTPIKSILAVALILTPIFSRAEKSGAFGFTFGEKIEAPKCSGSDQFPVHPQDGYCLVFNQITGYQGSPAYTGVVSARFKYSDLPFWTGGKLSLYLIEGRIEGIIASTGGLTTSMSASDDLIKKYGQPTEKLVATAQNGFGASFDNTILIWDLPDVKVKYFPIFGNVKEGRIDIFSPTGYESRQKSIKAAERPLTRGL